MWTGPQMQHDPSDLGSFVLIQIITKKLKRTLIKMVR